MEQQIAVQPFQRAVKSVVIANAEWQGRLHQLHSLRAVRLVGETKRQANPDKQSLSIKRHMGENYTVEIDGAATPTRYSAMHIRKAQQMLKLTSEGEGFRGHSSCILLRDAQKQATKDAG